MTRPNLTPDQTRTLSDPHYTRLLRLESAAPDRVLPLLGQLRLALDTTESGAPMTHPDRPFTSGAAWEMVAAALGTTVPAAVLDGWLDLACIARLAGSFGRLEPGVYSPRNVTPDEFVEQFPGLTPEHMGFDAEGRVPVTGQHIALLRNQQWQWTHCDLAEEILADGVWPGPSVDPKRVYGEMSYIALDMHRILDLPVELRSDAGHILPSPAQETSLAALHRTMLPVTQVFLENMSLDLQHPDVQATLATWVTWN